MFEWLQKCRLHQLIPVFINTGLSSLEAVATISGERVRELRHTPATIVSALERSAISRLYAKSRGTRIIQVGCSSQQLNC
jgi:hypothetical protein